MKIGQLEIDLDELAEFIVKAKKKGYASGGKYKKLGDGSKIFTFQEGNFHYKDHYSGSPQAPGWELVRWKNKGGQWIWFMSYSGGMLPEYWGNEKLAKETFSLLKEALSTVDSKAPFRGKQGEIVRKTIGDNQLSYQCYAKGDITNFLGDEMIWTTKQDSIIFKQNYIGGLIIPK